MTVNQVNNLAKLTEFVQFLTHADGLLVTAGAGMGIDSGLPDFRGDQGFWQAYPPLRHLHAETYWDKKVTLYVLAYTQRRLWRLLQHVKICNNVFNGTRIGLKD